jgi:hypothetical protein
MWSVYGWGHKAKSEEHHTVKTYLLDDSENSASRFSRLSFRERILDNL